MPSSSHGMEKRGVIAYGWTPPTGSRTNVVPGKTYQESKEAAALREKELAELEDDALKRLADEFSRLD